MPRFGTLDSVRRRRSDLFAEVKGLQTLLRAQGTSSWADELDDAVLGGATGTEIGGRLGIVFDRMRKADDVSRDDRRDARRDARRLLRTIRRDARRP
jgi:predicted acetyltransferase